MDTDAPNEKDSLLLRWAKFASIIIVLAVVGGVVWALMDYIDMFSSRSSSYYRSMDFFWKDTPSAMKWRFIIGAIMGGMGGVVYVLRCLRRGEDP